MNRTTALVVIVFATCAIATASARQDQRARFRSTADAVMVDVQVKDHGKPVAGLTAADFELRDSGVRQQIQAFAFADVPLSVLLVLDVSASVKGEQLQHLKDAAGSAVAALRANDQAALLVFSQRVQLKSGWTSDHAALATAIRGIEAQGSTSLHDAVFTSVALRERAAGRPVVIVFTDGRDTTSWLGARTTFDAALRSDIVFYAVSAAPPETTVGTGNEKVGVMAPAKSPVQAFDSDPELYPYGMLDKLTQQTGGELIRVQSTRDLSSVFATIVTDFKTRYLLTYSPKGVPASGWHPLEVTLRGKPGKVTARRGYTR